MFCKASLTSFLTLALLASTDLVLGRYNILERDNRAVFLYPRRFGKENPPVIQKLAAACPGQVCGTLSGEAITPLLAAQPECSQQDMADKIIDASKQFDAATQANMLAIAIEYRQAEKNTPPDFSSNPPLNRNSVFCQKAPKNPELNGLVQAQDPANDPDLFFDPATRATVRKGTQANTQPFGGAAQPAPAPEQPAPEEPEPATGEDCTSEVVVTVTVTGTAAATPTDAVTVTAGQPAPTAVAPPAGVDFGSCSVPQIEFGAGFDNRRETSFRPVDKASYAQGSAQNINIITRAMCDQLTNTCKANQAAKDLCASAAAKAAAAGGNKDPIQADVFNAEFGITTTFVNSAVIDDQGRVVSPGTGNAGANPAPATPVTTAAPATGTTAPTTGGNNGGNNGGIGNFGSCSVPEIEFAVGIDGRKETAFQPADRVSYGGQQSAQNINIIARFICDTLVNRCGADAQARATCATALTVLNPTPTNDGAQADAFNRVFGRQTNFASVQAFDNTGKPIGSNTPPANNGSGNNNNNGSGNNNNNGNTGGNQNNNNNGNNGNNGGAQAGNLQTFTGALGGVVAPTVTAVGNSFQVTGNASFNNKRNALVRSCDVQNNQCANAANASGNQNGFNVAACNAQQAVCIQNANASA